MNPLHLAVALTLEVIDRTQINQFCAFRPALYSSSCSLLQARAVVS